MLENSNLDKFNVVKQEEPIERAVYMKKEENEVKNVLDDNVKK